MAAVTAPRQRDPLEKALTHGLAFWAVAAPLWILVGAALQHNFALDFHGAFLPAAHDVLHGRSPYSAIGSRALTEGRAFLYPPLSAYLVAPFTLLPPLAAELVAVALVAACVPATLLVLGVRDWRCHAIAFLWLPTIVGIQTANLTLPMVLVVALIWRYRDRKAVGALLAGLVVALKLFFWPVLIWLVATRRYRTAALAAAASAFLVLVPWTGIGFAGLRGYAHLLSTVSSSEGPRSYSVAALLHAMLPSWTAATALETLLGAAILLLVVRAGRRGGDRDAFALSLVAILVLSPLLEMHYLALLLVVVALYRRAFGLAWVVPLLFWGAPATVAGSPAQVVHVLAVLAATLSAAYWGWEPQALGRALGWGLRKTAGPAPQGS
jgi:alpha-1,2-mannosyltransferase